MQAFAFMLNCNGSKPNTTKDMEDNFDHDLALSLLCHFHLFLVLEVNVLQVYLGRSQPRP